MSVIICINNCWLFPSVGACRGEGEGGPGKGEDTASLRFTGLSPAALGSAWAFMGEEGNENGEVEEKKEPDKKLRLLVLSRLGSVSGGPGGGTVVAGGGPGTGTRGTLPKNGPRREAGGGGDGAVALASAGSAMAWWAVLDGEWSGWSGRVGMGWDEAQGVEWAITPRDLNESCAGFACFMAF